MDACPDDPYRYDGDFARDRPCPFLGLFRTVLPPLTCLTGLCTGGVIERRLGSIVGGIPEGGSVILALEDGAVDSDDGTMPE